MPRLRAGELRQSGDREARRGCVSGGDPGGGISSLSCEDERGGVGTALCFFSDNSDI
ncbi:hypothetical protein PSAB6_300108 [Paraburkholderia sabiae]|nr:hypothetical protein PSAB6_300108 [Paraburkholderia sabiae]